ncbi:MAG TPA: anthranilate synthase component I family protein [Cyclobacteriaceae bacterium]
MKEYKLKLHYQKLLADTVTPVSIYLRLRDKFAKSFLLESSDYHTHEESFSFVCCQPLASFLVCGHQIETILMDEHTTKKIHEKTDLLNDLKSFTQSFNIDKKSPLRSIGHGLFGYISFDAVQYFEDIAFNREKPNPSEIPLIHYTFFKYVIALDHFKNELHIIEYCAEGEPSKIHELEQLIENRPSPHYQFNTEGSVESNLNNDEFLEIVKKGIHHCDIGDVFQVVFSRRFSTKFKGDEFQVYRALRSINPSPYLFYFDYGNFKIFGSSPEAQLVIKNDLATIYPIAGTFKRTGNDDEDREAAQRLLDDPKENSEHIMLVDLARNDLSRVGSAVTVETYKEVQYFSHVIHLVSKVTGKVNDPSKNLDLVAGTFPAGTLSGAPKHRAMELIDQYEPTKRGYYGGAIGFMDFEGHFNHAIMIRSFLSQGNTLHFQAGAGIVSKSNPESEVQEVYNKLAALQSALKLAENIS